jgi:hypothetical protein
MARIYFRDLLPVTREGTEVTSAPEKASKNALTNI